MPIGPRIAIIGAGSLRAAAPVLSTVFALPPNPFDRLVLCDTHHEKLDLFDRLARTFAATLDHPISIVATADMYEALEQANCVFLCFGLGARRSEFEQKLESIPAPRRGEAAPFIRCRILNDVFRKINSQLQSGNEQLVFNLVTPVEMTSKLLDASAFHIEWPPPLPKEIEFTATHRALRWVRADEPAFVPLQEFKESPLSTAILDSRPPPENRFDPDAVKQWDTKLAKLTS